jgi:exodeoxyribonuclease V gamma subunit
VPGVTGDVLRAVTYSRVSAKHRVATWVRLLVLTAAHPERPYTAATIGRGAGARVATVRAGPLAEAAAERRELALRRLERLVDVYDRGMREPLPLYCQTSSAYAEAARAGQDPVAAARRAWESEWNYEHEDKEPEHRLVLGGVRAFEDLLAEPPRFDEEGDGWPPGETTRLGRFARRVWDDLLAGETTTSA